MAECGFGRRTFLGLALSGLGATACRRASQTSGDAMTQSDAPSRQMPVLFVGHGSPMNAIEDNRWSRGFRELAADLPAPPAAYLAISAHWYVTGTYLTGNERPRTIHDFGGFPRELFEVQYPARGDVGLAERVSRLLAERRAALREDWGLDHGTWSVMRHIVPGADVPVVQLSIDRNLPPADHLEIGRAIAPLREQGVVILASGNITHNLRHALRFLGRPGAPTPPWASTFDAEIARALLQRDHQFLVRALETDDGRASHPTPDHYFPLLYAAGAAGDAADVTFPIDGFDGGSISMRAVRFA
jgi:4,5-DOPA dioxygenase extradiol